jgi:cephalosporin hydroxylase
MALLRRVLSKASTYPRYMSVGAAMLRQRPRWLYAFVASGRLTPYQYPEEFVPFLEFVRAQKPRSVVEIGTAKGATFFMLCQVAQPQASLVTIDVVAPAVDVGTFGHGAQRVEGIIGSSIDSTVREHVEDLFPDGVDVLFIDGDHAYEGVRADFELYRNLVRPGGLIAFHDIVPDSEERTGIRTEFWAGGVPKLWRELKASEFSSGWKIHEFVRSWDQEGLGIGVAVKSC